LHQKRISFTISCS